MNSMLCEFFHQQSSCQVHYNLDEFFVSCLMNTEAWAYLLSHVMLFTAPSWTQPVSVIQSLNLGILIHKFGHLLQVYFKSNWSGKAAHDAKRIFFTVQRVTEVLEGIQVHQNMPGSGQWQAWTHKISLPMHQRWKICAESPLTWLLVVQRKNCSPRNLFLRDSHPLGYQTADKRVGWLFGGHGRPSVPDFGRAGCHEWVSTFDSNKHLWLLLCQKRSWQLLQVNNWLTCLLH